MEPGQTWSTEDNRITKDKTNQPTEKERQDLNTQKANERQVQTIREMNKREVKLNQMRTRQTFKVKQETSLTADRGNDQKTRMTENLPVWLNLNSSAKKSGPEFPHSNVKVSFFICPNA